MVMLLRGRERYCSGGVWVGLVLGWLKLLVSVMIENIDVFRVR